MRWKVAECSLVEQRKISFFAIYKITVSNFSLPPEQLRIYLEEKRGLKVGVFSRDYGIFRNPVSIWSLPGVLSIYIVTYPLAAYGSSILKPLITQSTHQLYTQKYSSLLCNIYSHTLILWVLWLSSEWDTFASTFHPKFQTLDMWQACSSAYAILPTGYAWA